MRTELLKVSGMTCGGCTSNVTEALKAVSGVDEVNVSLSSGEAMVKYDEALTSPEILRSAVARAGYGVDAGAVANAPMAKGGCCC
jgi:copper chaperone